MSYWIVKANPSKNGPFEEWLFKGSSATWYSTRLPKTFEAGDRVVYWKSGGKPAVIALGYVVDPFVGNDEDGKILFELCCETDVMDGMPTIHELREIPIFEGAVFLKSGPTSTVFPLTDEQGLYLCDLFTEESVLDAEPTVDDEGSLEGRVAYAFHRRRERDPDLVKRKKAEFIALHGKLHCEACGLVPLETYASGCEDICEIHHRLPLSQASGSVTTKLKDLAVLCPNCHRAIHRLDPIPSVEKFQTKYVQKRSRNS